MTLAELMRDVAERAPFDASPLESTALKDATASVTGVTYDSRQAAPGSVFVALRGLREDGSAFARDAIARGAIAVIAETPAPPGASVPWVQVQEARLALAALSAGY